MLHRFGFEARTLSWAVVSRSKTEMKRYKGEADHVSARDAVGALTGRVVSRCRVSAVNKQTHRSQSRSSHRERKRDLVGPGRCPVSRSSGVQVV